MDGSSLLTIANIALLLASLAMNVWLYQVSKSDSRWATVNQRIADVDLYARTQCALHDTRISVIEAQMKALPTQDDLAEIGTKLSHIDRTVAGLEERSESTQVSVRRIEQYLLGNMGK